MSEIFEHSTLIEHLFAGRQLKQARTEKKTTLEQYLSANQETIDNQEEDEESQSSIKFLPDSIDILGDQEFWNFSKICGSIISDLINHLKFKQIQEFFAKVIRMDHPSKKKFNHNFKQRKELIQGLFECLLEWEDSLIFLESVSEFLNCIFQYGSHLYEHIIDSNFNFNFQYQQTKIYIYQKIKYCINEMLDLIIQPAFYFEITYKSKIPAVYKLYYNSICFLGILNNSLLQQQSEQQYQLADNVLKQISKLNTQIPLIELAIKSYLINMERFEKQEYEQYQYLFGHNNLIVVKSTDVIIRFHNQELIQLIFDHKIFDFLLHLTSLFHLNNQLHINVLSIFNYLIKQDGQRILNNTQVVNYLNSTIFKSKKVILHQDIWGTLKQIGYLLLPFLENDQINQSFMIQLLEFKNKEESFLLDIDPKNCKEIPPVSISIDRQIEK